jgi:hypothetical protein
MQETKKKKKSKNNIEANSTAQKKPDSFKDINESTSPAQKNRAPIKPDKDSTFPIVGIGASAGGLEAIEKFFSNMPSDSGISFIITVVSNRKKGYIFVNADGDKLSMAWFKDRINHYGKLLGIQKDVKYYDTKTGEVHPRHLVTCMALREAGERHHDNAGGSRKLSAVAAGHTMQVKERHYETVGEDFEQVHESYRKFHPAFVEEW